MELVPRLSTRRRNCLGRLTHRLTALERPLGVKLRPGRCAFGLDNRVDGVADFEVAGLVLQSHVGVEPFTDLDIVHAQSCRDWHRRSWSGL